MLKVGIFAPYVRNEVTLAATQFADWLVRDGIDVSYLSDGKVESGIHATWDNLVTRGATAGTTYRWAYGCTHLCWFSANSKVLRWARVVCPANAQQHTRHLYFPTWVGWNADCDGFLSAADRVISLSRDMHLWLGDKHLWTGGNPLSNSVVPGNRTWGNLVSSDVLLVPRRGSVEEGRIKLLAVLPRTVPEDVGEGILGVFDFLLTTHENLDLTLLLEASWPRKYRQAAKKIAKLSGNRLRVLTGPAYFDYSRHARDHDWVYVCNTRHHYGSLLSSLVSSAIPLICHDVPPVGAHIQDQINGVLIPCELKDSSYPIASVRLSDVGEALDKALSEDALFLKTLQLQSRVVLSRRQQAFERMITKEFIE
jgi:hypothetical protein